MKTTPLLLALTAFHLALHPLRAELDVPGDGSDGIFAPTASLEVDLSEAVTATWNTNNTANPGKGVYDPDRWAVVFKYSSVDIPTGVTVTFKNHPSRAPVVWLVSGDVTINGTVNLNGAPSSSLVPSEPGPGGFRGGMGPGASSDPRGAGMGPGGGDVGNAGAYATTTGTAVPYGNSKIVPLVGGSGAGAANSLGSTTSGTAGGGAILIGCRNRITLNGTITCRSGNIATYATAGSGGAVRLVADSVLGTGVADVRPGSSGTGSKVGGQGRIRLETSNYAGAIIFQPSTIVVPPDNPVILWPASSEPKCRIVSVDGNVAPNDPRANLNAPDADVIFPTGGPVEIVVEINNMPLDATVSLRVVPVRGDAISAVATHIQGNASSSTWGATIDVPNGHAAIQARAVAP